MGNVELSSTRQNEQVWVLEQRQGKVELCKKEKKNEDDIKNKAYVILTLLCICAKLYTHSLAIREMQIKPIMKYNCIPIRMAIIKLLLTKTWR